MHLRRELVVLRLNPSRADGEGDKAREGGREAGREGGRGGLPVRKSDELDEANTRGQGRKRAIERGREGGREGGAYRPLCSTREGKDSRPRMRVQEVRK